MSALKYPDVVILICAFIHLTGCASVVATSGKAVDLRVGTSREKVVKTLSQPIESHMYEKPVAIKELRGAELFHNYLEGRGYWYIARVESISDYEIDHTRDVSINEAFIYRRDAFVSYGALKMDSIVAQDFGMTIPFTLGLSEIFLLDNARARKAAREDDGVLFLVYYDHLDQIKTVYAFYLGDFDSAEDVEAVARTELSTTYKPTTRAD